MTKFSPAYQPPASHSSRFSTGNQPPKRSPASAELSKRLGEVIAADLESVVKTTLLLAKTGDPAALQAAATLIAAASKS